MSFLLYIIPVLAFLSALFLYRYNGDYQLLKLDLVQFFYTFVVAPLFFVWAKTFVFYLLRSELTFSLSQGQMFAIDTTFSLLVFYLYAFFVMHALTKSVRLMVERDPLFDVFNHSEYIHLWLTHLVMIMGGMLLFVTMALINVFFPVPWQMAHTMFYLVCVGGFITGCVVYVAIWLTDPRQTGRHYMRLMKLAVGICFSIVAGSYFIFNPNFSPQYGLFWFVLMLFTAMLMLSFFTYRSKRIRSLVDRLSEKGKDTDQWGINPQFFNVSEKPKVKG